MSSLILRTTTNFLLPVLLLFSLFLMLRGHNDPGGGFSGGLVAASAFVLYAMAFGVPEAIRAVRINPRVLTGAGLLTSLTAGMAALPTGQPLMTSLWWQVNIFGFGEVHLGTPLLFDLGVYLVVIGVTLSIILPLAEE